MKVDFDNLTPEQCAIFEQEIDESIDDYNRISSALQMKDNRTIWLINNVTSRNTTFSSLLYYIKCIRFLEKYEQTNTDIVVYTSNKVLYKLLLQKYKVYYKKTNCSNITNLESKLYRLIRIFNWASHALLNRSQNRIRRILDSGAITLIDIDIPKKSKSFYDRYYGNVIKDIEPKVQSQCWFFVYYSPISSRKEIKQFVDKSDVNIIFLWDFLSLVDFVKAFCALFTRFSSNYLKYNYKGIELYSALRKEADNSFSNYHYISLLYEKSIMRMREAGVSVRLAIDWFENQAFDKTFTRAFYNNYPETKLHSYIGFMADVEENPITLATNTEYDMHLAPRKLFVCNQALYDLYKKTGYKGEVIKAPFYRAENVWRVKRTNVPHAQFTIFLPLGLNDYEISFKVSFLSKMPKYNNVLIVIKPHPASQIELDSLVNDINNDVQIVNGNIYDYLLKADCVVASYSSTLYEALALGIPIMNFEDKTNRIRLKKPVNVPDNLWFLIKDSETFDMAISKIKNTPFLYYQTVASSIRDYYFTQRSVLYNNSFFCLN